MNFPFQGRIKESVETQTYTLEEVKMNKKDACHDVEALGFQQRGNLMGSSKCVGVSVGREGSVCSRLG